MRTYNDLFRLFIKENIRLSKWLDRQLLPASFIIDEKYDYISKIDTTVFTAWHENI